MPGRHITNQQVEIYMNARTHGHTQATSVAKAGFSERSAHGIEHNKRVDPSLKLRHWRTRKDPLGTLWESEILPMLETAPTLQPITLLEYLQTKYPDDCPDSLLRTLQRKVKKWRALYGPEKEVMFLQTHVPGRQALSDFTLLKQTTITIAGMPYPHLLYHFRLAYSHWSYIKVIEGGESFTALAEGLQEALERLGGAPLEHRTDSLSAAFKNLNDQSIDDMTQQYESLCANYSMKATRNNLGVSHENGSVESSHGHLKRRIIQALLLRGSSDFESCDAYQNFIDTVVQQHNRRNAKTIQVERAVLQPLPQHRSVDYTQITAVVSCASTIEVRRVIYTVPSRLEGEVLHVRIYHNRLVCYLGQTCVITLSRVRTQGRARARQIDYRHVIHSLVKKPQAFRYSRVRDDLLPDDNYKKIWSFIDKEFEPRQACKLIVGLLHLAATENCEIKLARMVLHCIDTHQIISLEALQKHFKTSVIEPPPHIVVEQHTLKQYNALIPCYQQEMRYA